MRYIFSLLRAKNRKCTKNIERNPRKDESVSVLTSSLTKHRWLTQIQHFML
jgi:hypothetical protein